MCYKACAGPKSLSVRFESIRSDSLFFTDRVPSSVSGKRSAAVPKSPKPQLWGFRKPQQEAPAAERSSEREAALSRCPRGTPLWPNYMRGILEVCLSGDGSQHCILVDGEQEGTQPSCETALGSAAAP